MMGVASASSVHDVIAHLAIITGYLPFLEVVIIGLLAGLTGLFAVLGKHVFFAESVTHAAFPGGILGVVIGVQLGLSQSHLAVPLLIGVVVFSLLSMLVTRWIVCLPGMNAHSAAGVILVASFAVGYLLNKWFSPLPLSITTFLTGSVSTVGVDDVLMALLVLVLVSCVVLNKGRELIAWCFDPSMVAVRARAAVCAGSLDSVDSIHSRAGYDATDCANNGIAERAAGCSLTKTWKTQQAPIIMMTMIILTQAALIPAVGSILPIALIVAPTASLAPHVRSVNTLIWLSPLCGVLMSIAGFAIAACCNLSVGGTIVVVAGICYLISRIIAHR